MAQRDKPRRRWLWASLATVLSVAFLVAVYAAADRGPYAFLQRWHPRHREIEWPRIIAPDGRPRPKEPPGEVFIFDQKDAPAVLAALKAELKARGFIERDLKIAAGRPPNTDENEFWYFYRAPSGAIAARGVETVSYRAGLLGGYSAEQYLHEPNYRPVAVPPKACTVVVHASDNWLQRQLRAIRKFLHLG